MEKLRGFNVSPDITFCYKAEKSTRQNKIFKKTCILKRKHKAAVKLIQVTSGFSISGFIYQKSFLCIQLELITTKTILINL